VPVAGVVPRAWQDAVTDEQIGRIERIPYECGRRVVAAADGDASQAVQYRATYAALIRFTQIAVSFSAFPG